MAWTAGEDQIRVDLVNAGSDTIVVYNGTIRVEHNDATTGTSGKVNIAGPNVILRNATGGTPNALVKAPKGSTYFDDSNKEVYVNSDGGTTWVQTSA